MKPEIGKYYYVLTAATEDYVHGKATTAQCIAILSDDFVLVRNKYGEAWRTESRMLLSEMPQEVVIVSNSGIESEWKFVKEVAMIVLVMILGFFFLYGTYHLLFK